MRILFVTPYIPSLIRVRPFNLIRALAKRGHEVTLLALRPPSDQDDSTVELYHMCRAVFIVPHSKPRTLSNGTSALFSQMPLQAAYSYSRKFDRMARELLSYQEFDVAHVEHLRGAVLANSLGNLPVVFDSVDSISLLFSKVLQDPPSTKSRLMASLDLDRTRAFEARLTGRFRHVTVTSAADRAALVELGCDPHRVHVVPNGVDLEYFQPQTTPRNPQRIVFTGKMSYHANVAAAEDLVHKVMPLVWDKHPQVELQIVGKDPTAEVQELARNLLVKVTGAVPDLRPHLAEAAAALAIMRYGVGIQNKALEAMAMATPVVASPQATAALQVQEGRDVLLGTTPEEQAMHIVNLLESPALRGKVGMAGRQYVEEHHNWDRAAQIFEQLYASAQQPYTNMLNNFVTT